MIASVEEEMADGWGEVGTLSASTFEGARWSKGAPRFEGVRRFASALLLVGALGCGSSDGSGGGSGAAPPTDGDGGPTDAPLATPLAALSAPLVASPGVPVGVNALGSTGDIRRYRFDFGDGTPAVESRTGYVLHRFAGNGATTVRVEVSGPAGSDVTETRVNVAPGIAGEARFDLPSERARSVVPGSAVPE